MGKCEETKACKSERHFHLHLHLNISRPVCMHILIRLLCRLIMALEWQYHNTITQLLHLVMPLHLTCGDHLKHMSSTVKRDQTRVFVKKDQLARVSWLLFGLHQMLLLADVHYVSDEKP